MSTLARQVPTQISHPCSTIASCLPLPRLLLPRLHSSVCQPCCYQIDTLPCIDKTRPLSRPSPSCVDRPTRRLAHESTGLRRLQPHMAHVAHSPLSRARFQVTPFLLLKTGSLDFK